jgi:hypothetical protein
LILSFPPDSIHVELAGNVRLFSGMETDRRDWHISGSKHVSGRNQLVWRESPPRQRALAYCEREQ